MAPPRARRQVVTLSYKLREASAATPPAAALESDAREVLGRGVLGAGRTARVIPLDRELAAEGVDEGPKARAVELPQHLLERLVEIARPRLAVWGFHVPAPLAAVDADLAVGERNHVLEVRIASARSAHGRRYTHTRRFLFLRRLARSQLREVRSRTWTNPKEW